MTLRTWVYQTLTADTALQALVGDRIFAGGALTSSKTPKPFIVYHIGNETDENLSETDSSANRRFFQVYIHDDYGDYMRIDDIGKRVKAVLNGQGSPPDGIMLVRFLERSQDLDDEVLRTIFNYLRYQAVFGQ